MSDIIAGVEVPGTEAAAAATRLVAEIATPLLFHHSRRVFLLGSLHARRLGLGADPELLYVAAMFHDTGLVRPYSASVQRFELDGADHSRRSFSTAASPPRPLMWSGPPSRCTRHRRSPAGWARRSL